MTRSTTRTAAAAAVLAVALAATLVSATPTSAGLSDNDPYLSTEVPVAKGCIVLGREWAGAKVALVQRRLGTTHELDRYQEDTYQAVRQFQRRKDLNVTGRVNRATWQELGMKRSFCMDRFTVQPSVTKPRSPAKRKDAMIGWARQQLGTTYIWGAAGPIGYDCSGFALQAMYAGGRVLPGVTTYKHQRQDYPTASRIFDSGLPKRPLAERKRGDLIFFGPAGSISHMGIYLGKGRVLEAVRPEIRIASMWGRSTPIKGTVVRPFGR